MSFPMWDEAMSEAFEHLGRELDVHLEPPHEPILSRIEKCEVDPSKSYISVLSTINAFSARLGSIL
jgi:hypothetical protein